MYCLFGHHLHQVLAHSSELLRDCQERARGSDAALELSQRRANKLDTAFKTASQEVLKVCHGHSGPHYAPCYYTCIHVRCTLYSVQAQFRANCNIALFLQGNEIIQKFQNEIRSLKSKVGI